MKFLKFEATDFTEGISLFFDLKCTGSWAYITQDMGVHTGCRKGSKTNFRVLRNSDCKLAEI